MVCETGLLKVDLKEEGGMIRTSRMGKIRTENYYGKLIFKMNIFH